MSTKDTFEAVKYTVDEILLQKGFESYPFKIGWYNDAVDSRFALDFAPETLAFVIISTPSMFEKAFLPFLESLEEQGSRVKDPIDQCMAFYFEEVRKALEPNQRVIALHDFELHHTRKPKVLVQTAGHVAGAARYYQRADVKEDPWDSKKSIFGVSLHPEYGGWFALRGVLIIPGCPCDSLEQQAPLDVLPDDASRIELLNRYNDNWRDWTYRDVMPVKERYSSRQKQYFITPPAERMSLVRQWREEVASDAVIHT